MRKCWVERYHLSLTHVLEPELYRLPSDLEKVGAGFIRGYNEERFHVSLNNVPPADVYFGRAKKF